MFSTVGQKYISTEKIQKNGLAFGKIGQSVGFKNGDKIVSIDGALQPKFNWAVIDVLLSDEVIIDRNGTEVKLNLTDKQKGEILGGEGKNFIQPRISKIAVDSVTPKSEAANAKLAKGDVIQSVNGKQFSYFDVFSQQVPFYQWQIEDYQNVIFGNEDNGWNTSPIINGGFLSSNYQSMDRISTASRYFRGTAINSSQNKYYKGYIYAVNANGQIDESAVNWDKNNPEPQSVTVGAPFYFYFGLKKGASAFDRFTTKWIDTTTFVN
jgi:hypothetical protein